MYSWDTVCIFDTTENYTIENCTPNIASDSAHRQLNFGERNNQFICQI